MKALKNISSLLILFVIATTCLVSCAKSSEKELDGTWKGTAVMTDNDGTNIDVNVSLNLNSDANKFNMKMEFSFPGFGKYLTTSTSGTWSVNNGNITFTYDQDKFAFAFDPNFEEILGDEGIEELKSEVLNDYYKTDFTETSEYSLNNNILNIEMFEGKTKLKKVE